MRLIADNNSEGRNIVSYVRTTTVAPVSSWSMWTTIQVIWINLWTAVRKVGLRALWHFLGLTDVVVAGLRPFASKRFDQPFEVVMLRCVREVLVSLSAFLPTLSLRLTGNQKK